MSVDRILLVSLDNLGDLVFASALSPPLRERFPKAAVDVWCKQYTADVAMLIPGVRNVIAADPFWDVAPGRDKGTRRAFLHALRTVRSANYDVALLAAAPWRTAAAVAAARIPRRIGLRRRKNRAFLTDALPDEDARQPVMSEMARLLRALGIAAEELRYRLDPAPLRERRERLASAMSRPYAALHPFASKENRCVAIPEWIDVARRLTERNLHVLLIGSAAELNRVRALGDGAMWRFVDRVGDASLANTAAALADASLFIGHDSGPLHIAGALGVPVVGVFAPGEPLRTFPQGVGPWRLLARSAPTGITAADILREVDAL